MEAERALIQQVKLVLNLRRKDRLIAGAAN